MSYTSRQQDTIRSRAARLNVDLEQLSREVLGTAAWESSDKDEQTTFEAALDRFETPKQKPVATHRSADRQASRVAGFLGAPAPRNTGRCHYCGQQLDRRGQCEECV